MTPKEAELLDSITFLRGFSPEKGMTLPTLEWYGNANHWRNVMQEPEFVKIAEDFDAIRKMAEELKESIDITKYRIIDRKLRELRILGMK